LNPEKATVRTYVRALEQSLSRSADRPVVFSSRDWELAARWHDSGIPLGLVLDILEERADRAVRSLAYIAPRVLEAWNAVLAGRVSGREETGPQTEGAGDPAGAWRRVLQGESGATPLRRLLEHLLESLDAGGDPSTVDRLLDEGIAEAAPRPLREEVEAEAGRVLEPYRSRMAPEVFQATLVRSVRDRIRKRLRLPRLDI
jgi:hypothetical protein